MLDGQIVMCLCGFMFYECLQCDLYICCLVVQGVFMVEIYCMVCLYFGDDSSYVLVKWVMVVQWQEWWLVQYDIVQISWYLQWQFVYVVNVGVVLDLFLKVLEYVLFGWDFRFGRVLKVLLKGGDSCLVELVDIGFFVFWFGVVWFVGYDFFVVFWCQWLEDFVMCWYKIMMELCLWLVKFFDCYQWNCYVEMLVVVGLKLSEICVMVCNVLDEKMIYCYLNWLIVVVRVFV